MQLSSQKLYLLSLCLMALWLGLIIGAPFLLSLPSFNGNKVAFLIYWFFSPVCHQLKESSFIIYGNQMAVCSRCFGIYLGMMLGVFTYPLIRSLDFTRVIHRRYMMLAPLPMVGDVVLLAMRVYPSLLWLKALTGLFFGLALPFYLLPALYQMINQCFNFKSVASLIQTRGLK
ncbi:hypothetical protein CEE39_09520 [bacterium (candidate division B38) B3_B38]|nr:MAG: hypothetical protein CEE39_09520 [bacterium (candidate division B38) B3_B38]